ncbi:hypothetical protein EDB19DRAFT_2042905 [Suillus lakei]|nr:hypothetical protein EDB19DRAFT_2042905 [Suillus lakei]
MPQSLRVSSNAIPGHVHKEGGISCTYASSGDDATYERGPQNTYMHYPETYELQYNSDYACGDPVHNPPSGHVAQYHNTAQGGIDFWPSGTLVTGSNLPPSCSPPIYILQLPPEPSSYRREPTSYTGSSAHYPEAYHGLWRQWHNPAIGDPQLAGSSLPEQLGLSMAPSPSAAKFSQPHIGRGGDLSNPPYPLPYIQPRRPNSHSRQSSRRHRGSHTHETHHSPSTTFSCGWLIGHNLRIYRDSGVCIKGAFREQSFIRGSKSMLLARLSISKIAVHAMRRDTTWRHVSETHLGMKRIV